MTIDFLDIEDVLTLHADQVDTYGGEHGVRDQGLLDSAVAQPRATFDAEFLHPDIFAMAAAYLFCIVHDHPFVDGNNRTGAVAALTFLDLNGIEVNAPPGALYDLVVGVVTRGSSKEDIAQTLRLWARTGTDSGISV